MMKIDETAFVAALQAGGNVANEYIVRDIISAYINALPRGKFVLEDRVYKTKGAQWQGHVCGFYKTELTTYGYAVESEAHKGSVQIYPEHMLELMR